jgi:hypothetical protein
VVLSGFRDSLPDLSWGRMGRLSFLSSAALWLMIIGTVGTGPSIRLGEPPIRRFCATPSLSLMVLCGTHRKNFYQNAKAFFYDADNPLVFVQTTGRCISEGPRESFASFNCSERANAGKPSGAKLRI